MDAHQHECGGLVGLLTIQQNKINTFIIFSSGGNNKHIAEGYDSSMTGHVLLVGPPTQAFKQASRPLKRQEEARNTIREAYS